MYVQQTLWDTPNITSSPGSAAGRMPSDSPDGRMSGPCGPDPALASLTPRQALERGMTTRGPYGGRGAGSSISVDLQLSLASRLRRLMGVDGSLEYELTWRQWDMPSGPPICALRASARRTSDNGCGGWPTPVANDDNKSPEAHLAMKARMGGGRKAVTSLQVMAKMAGWRTPSGSDGEGGTMDVLMAMREGYTPKLKLRDQAPLAGYPTPTEDDANNATRQSGTFQSLTRTARGMMPSGSPVQTERRGVLNPALSLWLMGYPDEWLSCGVRAMQSSRRSRRRS